MTQIDPLLDPLKMAREALKQEMLAQTSLAVETAEAYNMALYHIQAAREEIKRVRKTISVRH